MWSQIRIAHRRTFRVPPKATHQPRIRPEFRRTAGELPRMAQYHSRTPMHRFDQAPNMDIHIPVPRQLSHRIAVCTQAHHRKPALRVRSLRRANVNITSSIRNLHHVIDMCRNANVFVEEIRCVVRGNAGLRCRRGECLTVQQHDQRSSQDSAGFASGHDSEGYAHRLSSQCPRAQRHPMDRGVLRTHFRWFDLERKIVDVNRRSYRAPTSSSLLARWP